MRTRVPPLGGLLCFLMGVQAFAHSDGHGPVIPGAGPSGGRLAAVILASESENKDRASPVALAEWKRTAKGVSVAFLDLDRKAVPCPKGAAGIKVILLGKGLPKPVVFSKACANAKVDFEFPQGAQVETVELILPDLGERAEKQVVAFGISPAAS